MRSAVHPPPSHDSFVPLKLIDLGSSRTFCSTRFDSGSSLGRWSGDGFIPSVDLTDDEDPTYEDEDTGMGDSTRV
ncbi:hypothetical protein Tco_1183204 [Tanacetum coccineum]